MTRRSVREEAARKLRHAQRLHDAASDHYAIADEMLAESHRLIDEAADLMAGRRPLRVTPPNRPNAPTKH